MTSHQRKHPRARAARSLPRRAGAVVLGVALAAASAGLALTAGGASAGSGAPFETQEQAGYAATGAQFRFVSTTIYLRNAAAYAAYVDGYGYSVQMWTATREITLGVSDSTSASPYSPAMAVFDRSQLAPNDLVCSTAASGTQLCPGTPANWTSGSVSYPAGDTVTLSLFYDRSSGLVHATVTDKTAGTSSSVSYDLGTGASVKQVRAGAEFGDAAPWDQANFRFTAPSSPIKLGRFTGSTLTSYSGHTASFDSWWTRHGVIMAGPGGPPGFPLVAPSLLTNSGQDFNVNLVGPT